MIRLQEVKAEEREILWSINQKYQYETAKYYPDKMDEHGNYHYEYFDAYFTDAERKALFIYDDEIMVGFVMLNPYSAIEHHPDYTIAEFTIFPSYRRNHCAINAVNLILSSYHGKWEIKYNEKNIAAKKLWTMVTEPYSPVVYQIDLIMESDGQLHPIEIKKSINPPTQITGAFKLLDKASVPRGTGAIICLRETLSAIDSSTYIVPVWMI